MNDRRNYDTLTPEFSLRINGNDLPLEAKSDIISVSVMDDVGATGMFCFSMLCWDGIEMKVKWIDDSLVQEGNSVEIDMGYRDDLETLFQGEITGLEPEFLSEEPPMLTVRGYDRRHRLIGKRKTRTFLSMKDSDIASQIASDWSLRAEVEDSGLVHDYLLQHNQTDYEFLQERAQRIGYELIVNDKMLSFQPRKNTGDPVLTLNRTIELLDFSARLTVVGQVEEVFVHGWNPRDKEEFLAHSAAGDEVSMNATSTGPEIARSAFGSTGSASVDVPVQSQAEADQLAMSWLGEIALNYVTGHGLCTGQPALRAGTLVKIEGLGERFSGPYYVTSTEHSYKPNKGYQTAFTVKRNGT